MAFLESMVRPIHDSGGGTESSVPWRNQGGSERKIFAWLQVVVEGQGRNPRCRELVGQAKTKLGLSCNQL